MSVYNLVENMKIFCDENKKLTKVKNLLVFRLFRNVAGFLFLKEIFSKEYS